RCPNSLLIQTSGLQFPAFQAGNLRAYQRGSICEVLRTVLRPQREARVMLGQRPRILPPLVRTCRIRRGRSRERCIEVVVGLFKRPAGAWAERPGLGRRRTRLCVAACIAAYLQLAKPIPGGDVGRTRLEMLLEPTLVEPIILKRAELRRQSPCSADETELPRDNVHGQAELRFLREFERRLRFALHLFEGFSAGETTRDEMEVRIGCIRMVADFQCDLQATADKRNSFSNVPRPRHGRTRPREVHTSFEPVEAFPLDEIDTQLAEAETR